MFYDVFDVLYLKSILGFLLSERNSGVSLVIFVFKKSYVHFFSILKSTNRQCRTETAAAVKLH